MTINITPDPHSKRLTHPKYRADIDGLRAIAVLSVVSFHAFPNGLKGGFIGVDIFFIISGFLISTIIFSNLERGSFSFIEFYSRRIKRIFPALLLVLIACFVFGWFVLLADEYKQLGKHIAGGAGFVSNFMFWKESGYFDNAADTKPLLHLWSLGIEEQFYIVWPLLLWFAWQQRLNLLTITITVLIFSFALNISKVYSDTVAAFYLPQTRFWELLAGSVLAYLTLYKQNMFPSFKQKLDEWLSLIICAQAPEKNGNTLRSVQSLLGAILITFGVVVITKERHFPGWWAVFPTVGAVLIISAGTGAWLNRAVLSNRLLVWFGLISFPLYLWHWPLLSFARIIESEKPSQGIRIAVVLISIVLAWLTYKLIEKPIRFGNHSTVKTITLFVLMVAVGSVGYYDYKHNGLNFRLIQTEQNETFDYATHWQGWEKCDYVSAPIPNNGGCRILHQNKPIDIIVIGDSHAGHLASGLKEFFATRKENVAVMLEAGCYPFFPLKMNDGVHFNSDGGLIEKALIFAETTPSVKLIILSGYAALQINGNRYHEPSQFTESQKSIHLDAFKIGLEATLTHLTKANKKIMYLTDVPELYKDPKSCVKRNFISAKAGIGGCSIDVLKKDFIERNTAYLEIIKENKDKFPQVNFVNTEEIFCDTDKCYGMKNNVLLYSTRDHLTPNGSKYLINGISKSFLSLLP
jgi:peptidoglycan/LPS O-acetylase OafA/YrhL